MGAYDVIVVGARCAGSPMAMLLARRGYRVLVVDRATFPSDTVSTHLVHPTGVAALQRWGVLDGVVASGCPAIETYTFDFGPFALRGTSHPVDGIRHAYGPRRTVLDTLLVDAAAAAGAEIREGFTVDEILIEDGAVVGIRGRGRDGQPVSERARVVVGADGACSRVAEAVQAEIYNDKPPLQAAAYTYWSDLPVDGMVTTIRAEQGRGFAAVPTNDGLTMLVVGWPYAEHAANKRDVEGNYLSALDLAPEFADRVRGATRQERFAGMPVTNFFRHPYGPGWALIGDAGYTRDPITAQGITDAFVDAEACSAALDLWLSGASPSYDSTMAAWHAARDARVLPMYGFTTQLATLEPPPPPMQQLLATLGASQAGMDVFVSIYAHTLSPALLFDPDALGALLADTAAPDTDLLPTH